ncbi:MAG: MFS transporter [Actinomycetota bacterium]|nr:MFS transporter [Actinomycetota bacterium]
MSQRTAGWYPLLLAAASVGIANSVVFSLLSNLQDKYHFSDAGLGLIAGSGFAVGLVGQVLLAPYADRGHSKRLLIAGLGTAVLGSILFALAGSLLTLVLARMVVGLSNSLFMPASRAIAISISDDDIPKRLGTLSGVELAGFVTGPVVGGMLVGPFGLRTPFLVAGAFALAGALMLAPRTLPEPPMDEEHRLAFDLLKLPSIRAGVFMCVALFLPVGFYDATLDRYLTDLGGSDKLIGMSFLAYGIPFALLATTGGRLASQKGAMRVAVWGTLLVAPITMGYGFIHVPLIIVGVSAIEGSLQALAVPASQALVAAGAPIGRAAAAQGLAGASNLLVAAVTAYAAGGLYGAVGPEWMFLIAGTGVAGFVLMSISQYRLAVAQQHAVS